MKIYQKKNASLEDETVLVQLDRRHTVKEITDAKLEDNLRKTTRANSLGSFEGGHSSTDIVAVTAEKQINFTRRPTVITENELSSSWLYKDRKAKINSDDESVEDTRSTMLPEDHEDLEPRALHDTNLKPVPVKQRSRKMFSCCWYFMIVLVICIACLAVMSGVGGIVYMEYFAKLDNADTDTSVKNDKTPSDSKEIFQHPTHKLENSPPNHPKIPESILKDIIKNFTKLTSDNDVSRKVTETISQSKEDIFHNEDLNDSNNSKVKELNKVKSGFVHESPDIEMTEHPKNAENSVISRNTHGRINLFNIPISGKDLDLKTDVKNKDSLDLKNIFYSNDMSKTANGHVDGVNKQMIKDGNIFYERSNSEAEVSDSREDNLISGRHFNFDEMTVLQDFKLEVEHINQGLPFQNLPKENRIEPSVHILPNRNSHDHMGNSTDNHEDNLFGLRKYSIGHDPIENSSDHTEPSVDHDPKDNSIDPDPKDNSIDPKDNSIDPKDNSTDPKDNSTDPKDNSTDPKDNFLKPTKHSVFPNDKSLNDPNEDSNNFDFDESSEKNPIADDQNQNSDDSGQLVLIRPVDESKAVPVPLSFLRRMGFDIKNPNSHQPLTAKDMDIKFSLAEALKYLRSLDTDNKLPASREKTETRNKKNNEEEIKKTKLPVRSERQEYLNTLRKKIFEDNL